MLSVLYGYGNNFSKSLGIKRFILKCYLKKNKGGAEFPTEQLMEDLLGFCK